MAMTKEQKTLAAREAQRKYNATHDKINVRCVGGTFDRIRELGYESINSFIVQAVVEKLEREEKK